MVTVRKSKLLTPTSVIPENTYYYEFDCDTIAELPTTTYQGTIVAHGSLATIIANGRQYRINGEGEWCIQRYDASDPILIEKTITENGTYTALDEDVDGYSSVDVEVEANVGTKNITANGTYTASSDELEGYSEVTVDVVSENNAKFISNNAGFSYPDCIQSISIPNGVTKLLGGSITMGLSAPNLTEIYIPASVTEINTAAFQNCRALETITINKAEGSLTGAPWGAPNTTQVIWTG